MGREGGTRQEGHGTIKACCADEKLGTRSEEGSVKL